MSASMKSRGWPAWSVVCALLTLLPNPAAADRPGSAAGQFLMLGPGGRPAALGNAYTTAATGADALYWNPAALGRLERSELTVMHSRWFQDVNYNYAAFAWDNPILDGHLGANLTQLDYGEITVTRINGQTPMTGFGKTDAGDWAFGLGYGRAWDLFDWGITVKYVREEIAGRGDDAFACDLGLLLNRSFDPNLRFGVALLNLGSGLRLQSESSELPLTFKLGGVYRLPEPPLMLTADLIVPADDRVAGAVGLEWTLARMLALRVGYNAENDAGNGVTAGAGFSPDPDFSVDYAFVPYGELGDVHRVSLNYRFGTPPDSRRITSASRPETVERLVGQQVSAADRALEDIDRGLKYARQERFDLASQCFIEACRLEPENPTAAYNLATTYYAANQYRYAGEWFNYYTILMPNDPNGFVYLAICLEQNDRAADATAVWRRVLELDPGNRLAQSRAGSDR